MPSPKRREPRFVEHCIELKQIFGGVDGGVDGGVTDDIRVTEVQVALCMPC